MATRLTIGTALKIDQLSVLATLVLAFTALAALVLTGQAGIREDLRALQTDMLAEQVGLREEMRAGQAGLRADLQAGQAELREEMQAGQAELREEIRAGQAELREEMRAGQAELRAGQIQLREDLAALGVRLAVVEHRTDALEARLAATGQHPTEPCEMADCLGS